jgi:hypothetical protein
VGKRNRRAEPTTNKLKRRLSLTLTGRPSRLTSQRVTADVLRTRWSIPTVFRRGATTDERPHRTVSSPSPQGQAEVAKNKQNNQLRSTTVSTPPRLLMAAIKSMHQCISASVPILGITCPPHSPLSSHQLLVHSPHSSQLLVFSLPSPAPIRLSRC